MLNREIPMLNRETPIIVAHTTVLITTMFHVEHTPTAARAGAA